jgi:hypothetical protein
MRFLSTIGIVHFSDGARSAEKVSQEDPPGLADEAHGDCSLGERRNRAGRDNDEMLSEAPTIDTGPGSKLADREHFARLRGGLGGLFALMHRAHVRHGAPAPLPAERDPVGGSSKRSPARGTTGDKRLIDNSPV